MRSLLGWRAVIESNDFLQKVVAAVRIRKGMDESSLESHVAYTAGQPKTPQVATGAGAVVEILKNAGLLKEEGGNLIATAPEPPDLKQSRNPFRFQIRCRCLIARRSPRAARRCARPLVSEAFNSR